MEWPVEFANIHAALLEHLGYTSLDIIRVMSGLSGAATYLCKPESQLGRPNPVVVKVGNATEMSRDINGLRQARTMFRDAGQMLDTHVECGGMIALPLSLIGEDAMPFSEWYVNACTEDAVAAVDDLFRNVLRLEHLALNLTNRSVFRCHTIDDPIAVQRRLSALGSAGAQLWLWWEQAFTLVSSVSATRLAHGDLHGGNILVTADGSRTNVVDFGSVGEKHYLMDIVSLERDIRLKFDPTNHHEPERTEAVTERLRDLARAHAPSGVDSTFEYDVALATRFMFTAASTHASEEIRRAALSHAVDIQQRLDAKRPQFRLDRSAVRRQTRQMTLGLFAYSFLRLDQLPNGSWGRTVNNWMESLWAGDGGSITRDTKVRDHGGTDVLCSNVINLVDYLTMTLTPSEAAELLNANGAVRRAADNIASRRGPLGGVGSRSSGRGANDVRIRHTVMALLALISGNVGHLGGHSRPDAARAMAEYLHQYGALWQEDASHLFGCTMATARIVHLLDTATRTTLSPELADAVRLVLAAALPHMVTALYAENADGKRIPRPNPPDDIQLGQPFFWPYNSFWRMERSGLLMYLPLGLVNNGRELLAPVREQLGDRLASCLKTLLSEIKTPYDPTDPSASLIYYHRGGRRAPRDWGLSAELAALLQAPAIVDLLRDTPGDVDADEKRSALQVALAETFDRYPTHPEIFYHTHAASFFRVLWTLRDTSPPAAVLHELDREIVDAVDAGMTEAALDRHVAAILRLSGSADDDVDSSALVSLLVNKLESGYYADSTVRIAPVRATIEAYRGNRARAFGALAGDSHLRAVEPILESVLIGRELRTRRALDLGTGTGRHAALLSRMGFDVEILDQSPDMLNMAAARLGIAAPKPTDMLAMSLESETYDVVMAAESIIHLTRPEVQKLAAEIAKILTLQGVAYLTFQINNNSLVTPDGRFYAYFPDERSIVELLRASGLKPIVTTARAVESYEQQMYPSRADWAWLDVYCRRSN